MKHDENSESRPAVGDRVTLDMPDGTTLSGTVTASTPDGIEITQDDGPSGGPGWWDQTRTQQ